MKTATITALTKTGAEALRKQYEDSRNLRLMHKIQFKAMGYKQTVESQEPFTLRIDINNKYFQAVLEPEKFKEQIHEGMKSSGAKKQDYKIEVDNNG